MGRRRPAAEGQGAHRGGVPPPSQGPDPLHLPAPGRLQGVHGRADRVRHHGDRLRDGRAAQPLAAAARPDVRGRGPAGPPGRRLPPDARPRRPRCAARRCPGCDPGQGRGHRRRRLRLERHPGRRRHGLRRDPARPRHQQAARGRQDLRYEGQGDHVQRLRAGEGRPGRRPGHRRGADPGRQGPEARHQRAGRPHEARKCPCRHRDRPGRLLRGLPSHHARRTDLRGPQLGLLLRRQHAGRCAEHLHQRPHQRDAAVHRLPRQQRLGRGAAPRRRARQGSQHPRRQGGLQGGRRGPRPGARRAGLAARLTFATGWVAKSLTGKRRFVNTSRQPPAPGRTLPDKVRPDVCMVTLRLSVNSPRT
ncbi:Alanine dehydrogenase [Streptomyces misionensis JCM 4497]